MAFTSRDDRTLELCKPALNLLIGDMIGRFQWARWLFRGITFEIWICGGLLMVFAFFVME